MGHGDIYCARKSVGPNVSQHIQYYCASGLKEKFARYSVLNKTDLFVVLISVASCLAMSPTPKDELTSCAHVGVLEHGYTYHTSYRCYRWCY